MRKSLYFSLSILLFFAVLFIVSKVEKKTGPVIEKEISAPKNDFDTISKQLTRLVWRVLDSSGRDLYVMDKSDIALFFFDPITINGQMQQTISTMIFSKKNNISSTHEALEIQRKIYEKVLPKLNEIRFLRPYLAEFPITIKSLLLSVALEPEASIHPSLPYFETLAIKRSQTKLELSISQFVGRKKKDPSNHITYAGESPYKIVFRIPCDQVPGLRPFYKMKVERGPAPKNSWLLANSFPSGGGIWAHVVYDFVPLFCPQHNLRLVVYGAVEQNVYRRTAFGFVFAGLHKLSLDDARKLATDCAAQFLTYVKQRAETNEEIRNYLIEHNKYVPNSNPGSVPTLQDLSFRLSFWDENVDRRESPYIAEVRMFGQTLKYYTSDEGQHLVPVFEESVEDGMKFWRENNGHS